MKLLNILLILLMFVLAGCGRNHSEENDDGTGIDEGGYVITPEIVLFGPKGFDDRILNVKNEIITYNTVKDFVDLSGNCFGLSTHYGAVNKTNSFKLQYDKSEDSSDCDIHGMKLNEGENDIEGYASNDKGYTARYSIMFIRNPTMDFTGSIKLSEDEFDEDEHLDVLASIPIGSLNVPDEGSVKLYVYYDNGSREYLTNLKDDGQDGDVTPGDGRYSGTFNTDLLKEGRHVLKVIARAKGKENISAPIHINVFPADMDEMIKKETNIAEGIAQKYYANKDPNDPVSEQIKYGQWVSSQIKDTPNLVKTVVGDDGALGLYFKHLKLYVIMPGTDGDIDNSPDIPRSYYMPKVNITDENRKTLEKYEGFYNNLIKDTPLKVNDKKKDKNLIWSNNVLELSPFQN